MSKFTYEGYMQYLVEQAKREELGDIAKGMLHAYHEVGRLKDLLRYFLELPDRGIGDIETHRDKIKEAEEALNE